MKKQKAAAPTTSGKKGRGGSSNPTTPRNNVSTPTTPAEASDDLSSPSNMLEPNAFGTGLPTDFPFEATEGITLDDFLQDDQSFPQIPISENLGGEGGELFQDLISDADITNTDEFFL